MANRVIRNKPVSGHQVDLLLSCKHIVIEPVEAAVFLPKIGEEWTCSKCGQKVTIIKVGSIAWRDEE